MSEYESLREDIATVAESLAHYSLAVGRATGMHDVAIRKLWEGQAELRDDLHALANRVETLTRARLTEPAEVAERMVFVCRLNRGCNVSRPHIHADDGAVIYVENEYQADDQLRQREAVKRLVNRGDAA
jgi:hypothetical protein